MMPPNQRIRATYVRIHVHVSRYEDCTLTHAAYLENATDKASVVGRTIAIIMGMRCTACTQCKNGRKNELCQLNVGKETKIAKVLWLFLRYI